jgi:S-adenosylmethionine decarboxylase
MHLIIDGYGNNPDILQSEEYIYQLLDQYPAEINMTKISPPYVMKYVGAKPEEWGVSGFVLIAESHISIHTFVEKGYVNVDIFSCKSFDTERVVRDLCKRLQLVEKKTHLLDRDMVSLDYLNSIDEPALFKPQ